jgi:hypothetical protein
VTDVLQQTLPAYDFNEVHAREIKAPPPAVWQALLAVRLDQLRIARPLVTLRGLGNAPRAKGPLLEHGPVTIYARTEPAFVVGGFVGRPWQRAAPRRPIRSLAEFGAFTEPGWAKVLTDFSITPTDAGAVLRTETRILCTDSASRRRFTLYWAAVRAGSSLVRRDLLATIDRLAT